jgi:hypothetical protein
MGDTPPFDHFNDAETNKSICNRPLKVAVRVRTSGRTRFVEISKFLMNWTDEEQEESEIWVGEQREEQRRWEESYGFSPKQKDEDEIPF